MDSKKTLILKDVLAYLSQGLIIPENNRLLGTLDEDYKITGQCENYIDRVCYACARGSIIYSALMKERNKFKDEIFIRSDYESMYDGHLSNIEDYLIKEGIFTFIEFVTLEYLFEDYWYDYAYSHFLEEERDILYDAAYLLSNYNVNGRLEILIKAAIECGESITPNNIYNNIKNLTK